MDRTECIKAAEQVVAARDNVRDKKTALKHIKVMFEHESPFVLSSEYMAMTKPSAMVGFATVPKRIQEQIKDAMIGDREVALAEAQAKLDSLLEGGDNGQADD